MEADTAKSAKTINTVGQAVVSETSLVVNGEMVKEIRLHENDPAGIYFISIIADGYEYTGRIVYEK